MLVSSFYSRLFSEAFSWMQTGDWFLFLAEGAPRLTHVMVGSEQEAAKLHLSGKHWISVCSTQVPELPYVLFAFLFLVPALSDSGYAIDKWLGKRNMNQMGGILEYWKHHYVKSRRVFSNCKAQLPPLLRTKARTLELDNPWSESLFCLLLFAVILLKLFDTRWLTGCCWNLYRVWNILSAMPGA